MVDLSSAYMATDKVGNPTSWSEGLGFGLAFLGFFAGMAVLVWAVGKYL